MKAAWIWGIAALWAIAACGSVGGDEDAGGAIDASDNGIDADTDIADAAPAPDAAWECISNFDCDDKNRCSLDSCTLSRQCENEDLDGVAVPGAIQPPGDCQLLSCEAGSEESVDDNGDVPFDGLECTRDICTGGVPSNPPEPVDTPCSAGVCDGLGNCTGCTIPADCGADTFCRTFTCSAGICGVNDTADGTDLPPAQQTPGDCRLAECNGMGGVREVPLDTDLPPDDGLECTFETCFMGAPLHPPKAIDTPCSEAGGNFCDGAGTCVECNDASQCSKAGVCETDQCASNTCQTGFEPPGVPAPPSEQTPFDCLIELCDGSGGHDPSPDDSDVPFDMRECTDDVCTMGVPSNPNRPIHTPCSEFGGKACDGGGNCVECTMNSHCGAGDTCDLGTFTCNCPGGDCGGLDCDGDGAGECGPEIPFCCGSGPGATCAIQHDNGLGEFWYDCDPVGTYNEEQAFEACQAHHAGDPTACFPAFGLCGGGSGDPDGGLKLPPLDGGPPTGDGDAVCGTNLFGMCACWQFSGLFTGFVHVEVGMACACPTMPSEPSWY